MRPQRPRLSPAQLYAVAAVIAATSALIERLTAAIRG